MTKKDIKEDTAPNRSPFNGLSFRIIVLVLVPALILGAGMIWQSLHATNTVVTSLNDLSVKSVSMMDTQAKIQKALVASNQLIVSTSALTTEQQIGLLRNSKAALKSSKERIARLQEDKVAYASAMNGLAVLQSTMEASDDDILTRKYYYLLRSALNVRKLLESFLESHERTNAFLREDKIDAAKINYLFEERFRMAATQKRIERASAFLIDLSIKLQSVTQKEFNASKTIIISDSETTGKAIIAIVVMMIIVLFIAAIAMSIFTIARPLEAAVNALSQLASGKLDVDLPKSSINEIGDLSKSMDVFKTNMERNKKLEQIAKEERETAVEKQRVAMNNMANKFEQSVGTIVDNVSTGASRQRDTAQSMDQSIDDISDQSNAVMAVANESDTTMQTIASATEELASSVQEIGRQANDSAEKAVEVSRASKDTVNKVSKLAETAEAIGSIVSLIQDIAGQTNLLALNATIEAARAGGAGKGFAIVANEVKTLATQTEKATSEIAEQIEQIQSGTESSMSAIGQTAEIIEELNSIALNIAQSVKEQAHATDEIAKNVHSFAEGNKNVTKNLGSISNATDVVAQSATELLSSADELSTTADKLSEEVTDFIEGVRTG